MGAEGDGAASRGPLKQAVATVVGFFDNVGKIVGAIAGVLALATTVGILTSRDNDGLARPGPAEQVVDKSEVLVSADVPPLGRQNNPQGAND